MKLTPLFDRLLVERLSSETQTAAGLVIPDNAQAPSSRARVVAVGNGIELKDGTFRELFVRPGQVVLIGKYDGVPVKNNGEEYLFIREADVLAVID